MNRGKYIVIEGPEGVGKTTQVQLLAEGLQAAGLAVRTIRESDSQNDVTSQAIQRLTQDPRYPMNTKTEVLLYNAARTRSLDFIRQSIDSGITCLVDGNYLSTLAVQYYGRGDVPEYEAINSIIRFAVGDMEPDLTVVLDAEVSTLRERIQAAKRGYKPLDDAFLERVRSGYLWEAKQRNLPVVYATASRETVFKETWKRVAVVMAQRTQAAPLAAPQSLAEIISHAPPIRTNSVISQNQNTPASEGAETPRAESSENTQEEQVENRPGSEALVTNNDHPVYIFNDTLNQIVLPRALRALKQGKQDIRSSLLNSASKNSVRIGHSLREITTNHVVIENSSSLLQTKTETIGLGTTTRQPLYTLRFNKKDDANHYKYYVPKNLNEEARQFYIADMNLIFDNYTAIHEKLTAYLLANTETIKTQQVTVREKRILKEASKTLQTLLPVACTSSTILSLSSTSLKHLAEQLGQDQLSEAQTIAQSLATELVKTSTGDKSAQAQQHGETSYNTPDSSVTVAELAQKYLSNNHSIDAEPVRLLEAWPHNEHDLLPDMLYEHSSLPLEDLQAEVARWTYIQKTEVFRAYVTACIEQKNSPSPQTLKKARYSWDIVSDYQTFRAFLKHSPFDSLAWQPLTTRYGYAVPELIEQAGLVDQFEECFELSLKLYSKLQAAHYGTEAQYATLFGHKLRWRVTYNGLTAFRLFGAKRLSKKPKNYRELMLGMHEKLVETHPLFAETLKDYGFSQADSI